jgi:predicted Zn-dependent protease
MHDGIFFEMFENNNRVAIERAERDGNFVKLEALSNEAAELYPNSIKAQILRVDFLRRQGYDEKADLVLEQAYRLFYQANDYHPGDITWLYMKIADRFILLGKLEQAKEIIAHLLHYAPDNIPAKLMQAKIMSESDRYEEAIIFLRALCTEHPTKKDAYLRSYNIFLETNRSMEAYEVILAAQRALPQTIDVFMPHARDAHQRQDWEAAVALWADMQERFVLNASALKKERKHFEILHDTARRMLSWQSTQASMQLTGH